VFSLSPIKILLIVGISALVLGPDKLPETARKIGKLWHQFTIWQKRVEQEVRQAVPDLPSSNDLAQMVRSPINLLNNLAAKSSAESDAPILADSGELVNPRTSQSAETGDVDAMTHDELKAYASQLTAKMRLEGSINLPDDPTLN
jgi:Sec-independent protein translocase protein TatA